MHCLVRLGVGDPAAADRIRAPVVPLKPTRKRDRADKEGEVDVLPGQELGDQRPAPVRARQPLPQRPLDAPGRSGRSAAGRAVDDVGRLLERIA